MCLHLVVSIFFNCFTLFKNVENLTKPGSKAEIWLIYFQFCKLFDKIKFFIIRHENWVGANFYFVEVMKSSNDMKFVDIKPIELQSIFFLSVYV